MDLIHGHCTATFGVLQFKAGTQETAAGELVTGLGQQQPIGIRAPGDLVQLVDVVSGADFDEMHGALFGRDSRQVPCREDHHLERAESAFHQAVEGDLKLVHISFKIQ
ncbi:hypothetical protein D3C71_1483640 [compost metagenome]